MSSGRMTQFDIEQRATRQYLVFRPYLASHKIQVSNSSNRAGAKEKLQKMSNQDFIGMSVDIFDELQRRKDNSPDIPFLPVDPNLAANKNAARQKLATLAVSRFHLLCSDVMQELETRFPVVVQRYEEKFGSMDRGGASSGSSYQQNSMQRGQYDERPSRQQQNDYGGISKYGSNSRASPARAPPSRRGEDNIPPKSSSRRAADNKPTGGLDHLMNDLGNMMQPSNNSMSSNDGQDWRRQKRDLENEIEHLRTQLEESSRSHVNEDKMREMEDTIRSLRDEKNELEAVIDKMSRDYSKLKDDHEWFVDDYENQKLISNDIRTEASNLLIEIKNLTAANDDLNEENNRLRDELDAISKNPVKPPSSIGGPSPVSRAAPSDQAAYNPGNNEAGGMAARPDAVVSQQRVDSFQQAMSDFLNCANSDNNTSVLPAMKAIVISCRNITEDAESVDPPREYENEILDAKDKVSDSLGDMMTAAKNHATYKTSNVELLEDPASDLTNSVFALVDLLNSMPLPNGGAVGPGGSSMNVDELKRYLEDQTDQIVQAIQSLLLAMRKSTEFGQDFQDIVDGITTVVYDIVDNSRKTIQTSQELPKDIKSEGELVIQDLEYATKNLEDLGFSMMEAPSKSLKQNMASVSYEIAKYTKEWVSLLGEDKL